MEYLADVKKRKWRIHKNVSKMKGEKEEWEIEGLYGLNKKRKRKKKYC